MKKFKKFLALTLITVFSVGAVLSVNAAEFDAAWYAKKNPDVVKVFGSSPEALRLHYELHGKKEYRMSSENDINAQMHSLFNAKEYAELYPDIKAVFGDNEEAMYNHYLTYGIFEARRPSQQISYQAARELKETVTKAMENAGLKAEPGSGPLAAIIEGNVSAVSGANVQAAQNPVKPPAKHPHFRT